MSPEAEDIRTMGRKMHARFTRELRSCTHVSIEPGLDIALEVISVPTHSEVPPDKTFTLSITQKRKLKIEKQWEHAKFLEGGWYGYRWIGHCFMIEDRSGEMLMGDQLPGTETEAQLICRVANIAAKKAIAECEKKVKEIKLDYPSDVFRPGNVGWKHSPMKD
jgi:hypothetical protein